MHAYQLSSQDLPVYATDKKVLNKRLILGLSVLCYFRPCNYACYGIEHCYSNSLNNVLRNSIYWHKHLSMVQISNTREDKRMIGNPGKK